MSGKGPAGGFDFQSRLAAYVGVHIIAKRPLRWTTLSTQDVPLSVAAETGGSGDDIRVELSGSTWIYECQAKRSLSADSRLDEAIDRFAAGLPQHPEERGLLLVDGLASAPIRKDLRNKLEAVRQGLTPTADGVYGRVSTRLAVVGATDVAKRVYVQMVDIELDSSDAVLRGVEMLGAVLDDREQAIAAWSVLVADGIRLCREGGRRDYDRLIELLGEANIHLAVGKSGTSQRLEQLQQSVDVIHAIVSAGVVTPPLDSSRSRDEISIQLDSARNLVAAGRPRAAIDLLLSIDTSLDTAPIPVQARAHNIRASALLHLEDSVAARDELHKSLTLVPGESMALTNLAYAEMFLGNQVEALHYADEVVAKVPESLAAWTVIAQLRPEQDLPAEVAETPEVLPARAVVELRAGRTTEAVTLLRRALVSKFNPETAVLLAQTLWGVAFNSDDNGRLGPELGEARALLDRAIDNLRQRDEPRIAERAHIARGQVARLCGDLAASVHDFLAAVEIAPKSARAIHALAAAYLADGDASRALHAVEMISMPEAGAGLKIMRAQCLQALGRNTEVQVALEDALRQLTHDDDDVQLRFAIAEIALQVGLVEFAEVQLDDSRPSESWLAQLMRARISAQRGDEPLAVELFKGALESAGPGSRTHVRAEFGEYLRQQSRFRDAIDILEAGAASTDTTLRKLYGRVLFEAEEVTKAAALVDAIAKEGGSLPAWTLQLAAQVATLTENVSSAIGYFTELHSRSPDDVAIGLRLAHSLIRGGEAPKALELLTEIETRGGTAPRQLLQLAALCVRAGAADRALPLAYRALRADPDAADVQLAYIMLFIRREGETVNLDADTVGVDTCVTLRTLSDETTNYFIVSDAPRRALGELALSDPIAARLIGKKVGDSVTFRAGSLSETDATVTEIRTHFVYAFQDTLQHFPQRHPDNTSLQSFKVPEHPTRDDFRFVEASAKAHAERDEEILQMYLADVLPLGAIATLRQSSIGDAYGLIANSKNQPFFVEFSDGPEQSKLAVLSNVPAVLTRSALITATYLEIFPLLSRLHPLFIAPQSLMDELALEREELIERTRRGHTAVAYAGGGMRPIEVPAERFVAQLSQFDSMVEWIRSECSIRPRPLASVKPLLKDDLRKILGESSHDALDLAKFEKAEVYTDDLGLRRMCRAESGLFGFSTYGVLRAAADSGAVSESEVDSLVGKLLLLGHTSIVFTPRALAEALAASRFHFNPRSIGLIDRLRDASLTISSVISFCARTMVEVALIEEGRGNLGSVTSALVEAALSGRDAKLVLSTLEKVIAGRMQLLPLERDTVLEVINRYARAKLLGQRIIL